MALVKCRECGKEMSDQAKVCPHCGYDNFLFVCPECGYKIEDKSVLTCPNCGIKIKTGINKDKIKKVWLKNKNISLIVLVIVLIVISFIIFKVISNSQYKNLPIKVDISMTSYYGNIDYILDELGLDFDLVTAGANCFTGVQNGEFKTEKYGILHTEFRYCKSNRTQVFRVYNDEADQKLREPEFGELAEFDEYGDKVSSSNSL